MKSFLILAETLISITLIGIVLLQAKGTSASVLGGRSASTFRTRRGVEKTLFTATIVLGVIFLLLALLHPLIEKI